MDRSLYENNFLAAFIKAVVSRSQRIVFFFSAAKNAIFSSENIKTRFSDYFLEKMNDNLYFKGQHLLLVIDRSIIFT